MTLGNDWMEVQYKIHLPAYDGPLDLLLDLIRRQQIDIYDIPIAKITEQYLLHIKAMEELDIDVAGEFLVMAAHLIYVKSKMLLPPDPLQLPGAADDPRLELVHRLLEHEKFKSAAQMLQQKELISNSTWTVPGLREFEDHEGEREIQVSLFDLVSTFRQILERAKQKTPMEIARDEMTVSQVIEHLRSLFVKSRGPISLAEIFESCRSRGSMIVAFLAILEMVSFQAIALIQKKTFGDIMARRRDRFEEVMNQLDKWMGKSGLA
jgi:segregation and condensation protein A